MRRTKSAIGLFVSALMAACVTPVATVVSPEWVSIFDGETLDGWTPKIAGQQPGADAKQIFRVEDRTLRVSYDGYSAFDGEFGHLFWSTPLSHYRLRFEYRFDTTQTPSGPGWAFMNSGVMVHAQAPETMRVDQPFPVSIEAQLLGTADPKPTRTTANMCSPGTHVVVSDVLIKRHCVNSQTPAVGADEWVSFEIEVRGGAVVTLKIEGEDAFRLTAPEFDPNDPDVARLGLSGPVEAGYFALQAESHPVAFRNIELMQLELPVD